MIMCVLSCIYSDFLSLLLQTETEEVKADPQCEKIEKEMNKLFYQLDALCNFKYTPMKVIVELIAIDPLNWILDFMTNTVWMWYIAIANLME